MERNYEVLDYYENPFGERIFIGTKEDCEDFCKEYTEDTDGECKLRIRAIEEVKGK